MKSIPISELQDAAKVSIVEPTLTKEQKLLRWAELVRAQPVAVTLFSNLERWKEPMLSAPHAEYHSAFKIAADDPKFRAAGLADCSVAASMKFFDLTQEELHAFSCDCGGHISNANMAERIERLACRQTPVGFFSRLVR